MIRALLITFLLALIIPVNVKSQVVINECMASNHGSFTDSLQQSSDWIELYNANTTAINLEGWYLSDDSNAVDKWPFPGISIQAGGFLLIYASGEDLFDGYHYHTSFRLNSSGEEIVLTNGEGGIEDYLEFGRQFPDISYGRREDGHWKFVFFDPGTPGSGNNPADTVHPVSTDVVFSTAPGFYRDAVDLEITTSNPAYNIYYTINGESPNTNGLLYTEALQLTEDNMPEVYLSHIPTGIGWRSPIGTVNQCHVIRAQAFQDGQPVGRETIGSFFIEEKGDDRYDMPVLSIITDPRSLFAPDSGIYFYGLNENYNQRGMAWEKEAFIEFFDDGDLVIFQDLGIRVTGGGSRIRPQKSLKLYPRSEYGKSDMDYPFFGEEYGRDFKRITLRALNNNWTPTAISDDVAHQVSFEQDLNYDYQLRRFAVVFVNGEYWGVHSLRETTDEFFIAKRHGLDDDDIIIDGQEFSALRSFVEENDMTDPEQYEWATSQLDVDNLLDYYVSQLFFANNDWPHNNTKAWKSTSEDGKWRWIFFDLDGGMQQYKHGYFRMFFEPEELHVREDRFFGFKFFRSLLQNEEFRDLFKSKLIYHLNNTFRPDITVGVLRDVHDEMEDEIKEHIRRWNYPNSIRRWRSSIESTANFFIVRPDILLTEVFDKLGLPLDVFPNPVLHAANGELELGTDQYVYFYLTAMDGTMILLESQQMYSGKNSFSLNLEQFEGGMYLLSAVTEHQMYTGKIVVAH